MVARQNIAQEQAYQHMRRMLNEKQWGQYLTFAVKERGCVSLVAWEAVVSVNTMKRGLSELEARENYQPGERACTSTITRSMPWRTISLRSATVVVEVA